MAPGQWVHMIGIAGAGMSGIARVLCEQGIKVTGSDLQSNQVTEALEAMGIEVYQGHSPVHIREGVDLVVISSAIPMENSELQRAREKRLPILKRGQMLARIMNNLQGIAVAGAHGKTTTTSMLYSVLEEAGVSPTLIVGGEFQDSQPGAKLGSGEYAVVEADESDASFLELHPHIAVITNIEDDHLDYYHSLDNIQKAFKMFLQGVKAGGFAVVYGEDPYIRSISGELNTPMVTFGEREENDYAIRNWTPREGGAHFSALYRGTVLGEVDLAVPGKHNALNALAAIAVSQEMGLGMEAVCRALFEFKGAKRRFQLMGEGPGVRVVDDYAHHPTEIKATIQAARTYLPGARLVVVFQPHRYTRTQLLGKQLGEALAAADLVIVTDIYSAGEKSIAGVSAESVHLAIQEAGGRSTYLPSFSSVEGFLIDNRGEKDLVVTMGAGDVWRVGVNLLHRLQ